MGARTACLWLSSILYPLSSILAFGGRAAARPYQVFHLVSACFTWFQLSGEKNWSGEAENLRFYKAPNTNIQAPENVQMPITKRSPCKPAHRSWRLGIGVSMELGGWHLVLRGIACHFGAFLFHICSKWSQGVSACFTWLHLRHAKTR